MEPIKLQRDGSAGESLMKILVAEDNAFSRTLLTKTLGKAGYDVIVAENGDAAWDALQQENPSKLADSLQRVIAQTLCKRIGGGRIASCEILVVTPAVSSNIRKGKTHQIPSLMQTGRKVGICTFFDDFLSLVKRAIISPK